MPKRDDTYMAERREKILDAAVACLIQTGLPGLSTTAICREAGISMGALYTHFATKDEILLGLAERAVRRRREAFNFKNAADMRRRLMQMAEQMGTAGARQGSRADLELFSASYSDTRIAAALQPLWDFSGLVQVLEGLQRAGEIRAEIDPKILAAAIETQVMGAMIFGFVGADSPRTRGRAMALFLDGVLA